MKERFGVGDYQYELVEGWGEWPLSGVASDVATDSQDRVYVAVRTAKTAESKTGAILVFDKDGKYLRSWGEDLFTSCHGLWISPADEVFHTDAADHTVTKFNTEGKVLMTLGTRDELGAPGMPFRMPTRAVGSTSGDIYVSDGYQQNRCHKFTPDGELVLSWGKGDPVYYEREVLGKVTGTPGDGPGEFNLPHDITVDRNDLSYVQDRENHRCQVFDPEGNYITEWSGIRFPNDAVIDENDVMHIAEGSGGGILLVKLDGEVIGRWGEKGDAPGQWTGAPHGLWLDSHGDMYVAEVGAQKALQKFARV